MGGLPVSTPELTGLTIVWGLDYSAGTWEVPDEPDTEEVREEEMIEELASYQRCVALIHENWPRFLDKPQERLVQQDRYGAAAEKVAESCACAARRHSGEHRRGQVGPGSAAR